MKTITQLDALGYFVGSIEADESPMEPGVYLIPAGAVDVLPPNVPDGFAAKWNGVGFDMEPEPEPEPAPEPPSIEDRRATVWSAVKSKRDSLKSGGVQASGHWFDSDADSRIQQLGLVMMGANVPAGLMWKTKDNGMVEMTQAVSGAIFAATAAWDAQLFGIGEQLRTAIYASDNPESIDIVSMWPAGFSEQAAIP